LFWYICYYLKNYRNNEYVQKYCYRPPRDSFIQRAIDSIPTRDPESTEPNNEGNN